MPNPARDYIFGTVDDQPRLTEFRRAIKPFFVQKITHILQDAPYHLADFLRASRQPQIIDVGCAEGLYLHDLAELLEVQDLLDKCNLIGIDTDHTAIMTADEFRLAASPARPQLNFYVHNAFQPFTANPELVGLHNRTFDFIYVLRLIAYVPNARQMVKRLYESLNPGGVIYFGEFAFHESQHDGWVSPPCTLPFFEAFSKLTSALNQGEVALAVKDWLKEEGAEAIETDIDLLESKGDGSPESLHFLRLLVATARNIIPSLVAAKMMTQEEADATLERIFKELNMHSIGQLAFHNVIARKPS